MRLKTKTKDSSKSCLNSPPGTRAPGPLRGTRQREGWRLMQTFVRWELIARKQEPVMSRTQELKVDNELRLVLPYRPCCNTVDVLLAPTSQSVAPPGSLQRVNHSHWHCQKTPALRGTDKDTQGKYGGWWQVDVNHDGTTEQREGSYTPSSVLTDKRLNSSALLDIKLVSSVRKQCK